MDKTRFRRLVTTAGSLARGLASPFGKFVLGALVIVLTKGFGLVALAGPVVMGSAYTDSDFVRQLFAAGILDKAGGFLPRAPVAKTANYQIVSPLASAAGDACGTLFTNRGAAGAVTFTLPVITANMAGLWYEFRGVAGQNITVAAAAGTVVAFNNAAATSVTTSTAGQLIGAHQRAVCDGTSWHITGDTVGVTYTVA
jgi:hypothetical protein